MPIEIERHDSAFGRWVLARWSPAHLAPDVAGIWAFEGTLTYLRERHFPRGTLELIVHLGQVYRAVDGHRCDPFPRVCIGGLQLRPDVIEAPPGTSSVLGMRLTPAGAFRILGRPLHELTGLTVDLDDLMRGAASELEERCGRAAGPEGRLRAAAAWAEACLQGGRGPDGAVGWMAEALRRRAGAVSIGELRARTGWSKTRITTAFREQIGLTPKRFARVLRFGRALGMVNAGEQPLVEVALAAGYYDQAHLNGEFRALSGFSPGEYRRLRRFPVSVSVAEHPPRPS